MSHHGHSHGHSHGPPMPKLNGPQAAPTASPEALAVADFLKSSKELKARTCIHNGQRTDLFKGSIPVSNPFSGKKGGKRNKTPCLPAPNTTVCE